MQSGSRLIPHADPPLFRYRGRGRLTAAFFYRRKPYRSSTSYYCQVQDGDIGLLRRVITLYPPRFPVLSGRNPLHFLDNLFTILRLILSHLFIRSALLSVWGEADGLIAASPIVSGRMRLCSRNDGMPCSPCIQTQPPKPLEQARQYLRIRHYSLKTEKAYLMWIKDYIYFNGKKHPDIVDESNITQYISHLAVKSPADNL